MFQKLVVLTNSIYSQGTPIRSYGNSFGYVLEETETINKYKGEWRSKTYVLLTHEDLTWQ